MEFHGPRDPREWHERWVGWWPDPIEGPWKVTIGFREIKGRFEPAGIKVEDTWPNPVTAANADDTHILTAKVVREIPVGDLVKMGRRRLQETFETVAEWDENEGDQESAQRMRDDGRKFEKKASGRPVLSDEHYRQVAEIWMEAWNRGYPPTKAVQDRYVVSYPTAARWATESRRRGFLQAYEKAGGVLPPQHKKKEGAE